MRRLLSITAAIILVVTPVLADYRDGRLAHSRGDYSVAVREWLPLAQAGDARARYGLGVLFLYGRGVERDPEAAAALFAQAAEQGHARAQYALAVLYQDGTGVIRNLTEAVRLYRLAALQDHAGAQNNLGTLYVAGEGVPQDRVAATMWFTLAATAGDAGADENRLRLAVEISSAELAEAQRRVTAWLEAEPMRRVDLLNGPLGQPNATVSPALLALVQMRAENAVGAEVGMPSLPIVDELTPAAELEVADVSMNESGDLAARARELLPLVELGDAGARYELGVMLLYGRALQRDPGAAADLFAEAAVQGYVPALYALGALYQDGVGVIRNLTEAARLYRLAAVQGHARAQNNLGILYAAGWGVELDRVFADMYFNLAARAGIAGAHENRERLASAMSVDEIALAERKALEWASTDEEGRLQIALSEPISGFDGVVAVDSVTAVAQAAERGVETRALDLRAEDIALPNSPPGEAQTPRESRLLFLLRQVAPRTPSLASRPSASELSPSRQEPLLIVPAAR